CQVFDRLPGVLAARVVVRETIHYLVEAVGIATFQCSSRGEVEILASRDRDARIDDLVDERMLEGVLQLVRRALLQQESLVSQRVESAIRDGSFIPDHLELTQRER